MKTSPILLFLLLLATASFAVTETHGMAVNTCGGDTGLYGEHINMTASGTSIINVTKYASVTATTAYIYTGTGGTLLDSAAFVGDSAIFTYAPASGTDYMVVAGSGGAPYTYCYGVVPPNYPIAGTYLTWLGRGTQNGQIDTSYALNIVSIEVTAVTINPLIVNITSPENTTYYVPSIGLNVTASGDNATYALNITEDGNYLLANQEITNGTLFSLTNTSFSIGAHQLNFSVWNNSYGNSSNITFTLEDTTPPTWSDNASSIPMTNLSGDLSYFNITWADDFEIDTVLFESNYSGVPTNYTMNNLTGGIYNYSEVLPSGTFYWKSWANDTSGNENVSDEVLFTISNFTTANYTLSYYSWTPYTLYTVADGLITVDDSGTFYITYAPVQAAIPYQTLVITLFAILGMWLIYTLFAEKRRPRMPKYHGVGA